MLGLPDLAGFWDGPAMSNDSQTHKTYLQRCGIGHGSRNGQGCRADLLQKASGTCIVHGTMRSPIQCTAPRRSNGRSSSCNAMRFKAVCRILAALLKNVKSSFLRSSSQVSRFARSPSTFGADRTEGSILSLEDTSRYERDREKQ